MRCNLAIILIMFCVGSLSAQNIIPNPSFEDTAKRMTPLYPLKDWDAATDDGFNYFTPLHNNQYPDWGTPNNIFGNQVAKTGVSYIGILVYDLYESTRSGLREYAQVKLINPLKADSSYCLQLFMSMADSIVFASKNQMGVYFSSNKVSANNATNLPYTPQIIISPDSFNTDKENWVEYNFEYKATGGEKYMTVGNFNDTTHLDTLYVGGGNKFWMKASYYYLDDFYLGSCDSLPLDTPNAIAENSLLAKLKGYPNPVNEQFTLENNSGKKLSFQLYNLMGSKVKVGIQQNNNKYIFSMGHLPKGAYLLQIIGEDELATMKLIKK